MAKLGKQRKKYIYKAYKGIGMFIGVFEGKSGGYVRGENVERCRQYV